MYSSPDPTTDHSKFLMPVPRISASSYSNTAPLVWSFLYGQNHGKVEIILDTAPARSAQLLADDRVDAALVPVIAFQQIEGARLVPDVCVGAKERVRSVCLVTKGEDLENVRTVALDISSKTSVALTKIIFKEFLCFEPEFKIAEPNIKEMLTNADCALLIGDPALSIAERSSPVGSRLRKFDLAETWRKYTGLGFVFATWMSKKDKIDIDFAAARDEGIAHIDEIISNYQSELGLDRSELRKYLTENISFSIDASMRAGMDLYFKLAEHHGLIEGRKEISFL